jgi:hypothetical protein
MPGRNGGLASEPRTTAMRNQITMNHSTELPASALLEADKLFFAPVLGYRCLPANDPRYQIGERLDNSMSWQDDECTGEELPGACALVAAIPLADAIQALDGYHGKNSAIYIVAGDGALRGQDPKEVILSNPHVVGIIR